MPKSEVVRVSQRFVVRQEGGQWIAEDWPLFSRDATATTGPCFGLVQFGGNLQERYSADYVKPELQETQAPGQLPKFIVFGHQTRSLRLNVLHHGQSVFL